jgi:KDO2-lipid IV(A) lauroyltransferase
VSLPIELPEGRDHDAFVDLTQRVAEQLEEFVRARPEEWHVFQPFWPSDKSARPTDRSTDRDRP